VFHVRVDCLQVVGDTAYISGQTTEQSGGFSEGTEILWSVQDNRGSGNPDLMSFTWFSPGPTPHTCQTFHAPLALPVTSGQVSVHSG
jgi:hypothetical protein